MKALIVDKLALGSLQRIGRHVAPPFEMFKQELHHVVSLKSASEGAGSQAIHVASAPPSDSFGAIEPPRCGSADGVPFAERQAAFSAPGATQSIRNNRKRSRI
jgi:hypothetical protein